jgi:uncharacterized membrane protein
MQDGTNGMSSVKGALIAVAVAGLFGAGVAMAADAQPATGKAKCLGINSCKGQGLCSAPGLAHTCAGKNDCKGKGWIYAESAADCTAKGGRVVEPAPPK